MKSWISENWYIFWGVGGAILIGWLHFYARGHPDSQFASHWERLRYAGVACVVLGAIAILLNGMLQGFLGVELFAFDATPYVVAVLFAVSWFAAPHLRRLLPIKRSDT
jgi:hypothetical protein